MAVKTLQITQTGSAIQFAAVPTFARWILLQNEGAAASTFGDSTVTATRGYVLPATPSGGLLLPALADAGQHYDLSQFYTVGTSTQVLNVIYDSMN